MAAAPPDGTGFHEGEAAVQQRAGVAAEAEQLRHMVEPNELGDRHARFLAERTLAALTARDSDGVLWISLLAGPPGFLEATSAGTLTIRTVPVPGDPLDELGAPQSAGLIVIEPATRRRIRINGTLTQVDATTMAIGVEQVYGNCPQYIRRRQLTYQVDSVAPVPDVRRGSSLDEPDRELIEAADTFFLGTTHPERGDDASHRGGPAGFVRVEGSQLVWPDYPGNNMFNSFGNLAVDPTAAVVFADFESGRVLHLSGSAVVEWHTTSDPGTGELDTGRTVRFTVDHVVAGTVLRARTWTDDLVR
jgi:uncharacterized protein